MVDREIDLRNPQDWQREEIVEELSERFDLDLDDEGTREAIKVVRELASTAVTGDFLTARFEKHLKANGYSSEE